MVNDAPSVRSIFEQAVELASAAERAAFLDVACAGQAELRSNVEALLRAHANAGSFLESPVLDGPPTTAMRPIAEQPGEVIGPYKLLQQIGEGGMGVVFMAEQTVPVKRTVALKIIKPGMDTRQVIARFDAERQALALMDHPNIAKVLDAGATSSSRPFFAMELVKGVPITKYCDDKHLPLRDRLMLFTQVCQAVQHAHQKGVIHRDLKPNNVLVAEYDHHAVPKVIDFGVAKATAQKLTERTMFTEFGQVVGTLEYMSPEQAKLNQLDVDTRSDVYSLGVLLYELLAGSTPFERSRLQEAAFDEILRIIREEEPPKPSTRLSSLSLGERAGVRAPSDLSSIAANRGLEPLKLNRSVQGELDWIVMKALEKDRNRRYETANGLADDVQRYLNDEAVQARPTTRVYRLRKFARRNKAGMWAGGAIVASLVLGLTVATVGFLQARDQARVARAQAVRATQTQKFLQEMLTSINPDAEEGADVTVPQLLNRAADNIDSTFADQPEVRINLHEVIGQAYYGLVRYEQAMPHLQRAVDLRQRYLAEEKLALADALLKLAQVYSWDSNKHDLALARSRDALAIYKTRVPASDERVIIANSLEAQFATPALDDRPISPDVWAARVLPTVLGLTQDQIDRLPRMWGRAIAEAQELNRAGDIPAARAALDHGHKELIAELRSLGSAGQIDAARQLIRQAYSPWMEMPLLRAIMPIILISEAWELRRDDKNLIVAEVILREAAAAGREVWGQEHPYIARAFTDLAIVLQQQGRLAEAERSAHEALAMRRKLLGIEDPETIISAELLIDVLTEANKPSEADSLRREFDVTDAAPAAKQESK